MTNKEKAELLVKAGHYIKINDIVPAVHIYEKGAVELDTVLINFVKYIGYEKHCNSS